MVILISILAFPKSLSFITNAITPGTNNAAEINLNTIFELGTTENKSTHRTNIYSPITLKTSLFDPRFFNKNIIPIDNTCLLYTSDAADE